MTSPRFTLRSPEEIDARAQQMVRECLSGGPPSLDGLGDVDLALLTSVLAASVAVIMDQSLVLVDIDAYLANLFAGTPDPEWALRIWNLAEHIDKQHEEGGL